MRSFRLCLSALAFVMLSGTLASAAVVGWTGRGPNSKWSTARNWSGKKVPGKSDTATFSGKGTGNCTIDTDIDVAGIAINKDYTGTITQAPGKTVTVGASNFDQAAGTFNGGDSTIDIKGTFTLSGGSFTATSGTMSVMRDMTVSGGTFGHNSGGITYYHNLHGTVDIGKTVLNDVVIDKADTYSITVTGTMDVDGSLTITSVGAINKAITKVSATNKGTIAVAGDVITTDKTVGGSATIRFDGPGDQNLKAGGGTGGVPGVEIDKSGGILRVYDTICVESADKAWAHTKGKVDMGSSVIEFCGACNMEIDCGNTTFNDVVVNMSGTHWISLTGVMDVDGNLTCTSGCIRSGTIAVAGDVVTTNDKCSGLGVVKFDGSKDQNLKADGGSGAVPGVEIDKPGGTLYVHDTILVPGSGWKHTKGKVDAGSSTVKFTGKNKTVDAGGMSFNNVILSMASNHALTVTGTMQMKGDLTIAEVGNIYDGTIVVGGKLEKEDQTVNGTAVIKVGGSTIRLEDAGGRRVPRDKAARQAPVHMRKKGPPWTKQ